MKSSTLFADQSNQPPTTQRPDFTAPNPYARQQFDTASATVPKLVYDAALIKKYQGSKVQPQFQYTLYPTVLELKPIKEGVELDILNKRDPNTPLSLNFNIPFCHHGCYYCACNTILSNDSIDAADYLATLKGEIKLKRAVLEVSDSISNATSHKRAYVKQLHLGGTPTFFSEEQLIELWTFLQTQFEFAPAFDVHKDNTPKDTPNEVAEIGDYSIEIDPRALTDNTVSTLRKLGFNRLSIGVQDLDDKVQLAINRVQSEALIQRVITEARTLGFKATSIDLIYGLPQQTPQSFSNTLLRIVAMSPDRLSVSDYAHLPASFKLQPSINEGDLPTPSDKLTMLNDTIGILTAANYQYIGSNQYTKRDDELATAQREGRLQLNAQGYTAISDCDLLGFGVSAISQIHSTLYANKGSLASHVLQNSTDVNTYQSAIHTMGMGGLPAVKHIKTTIKDRLRGYVISNLICHDYIDFKDLNQKFGIDAITYFIDDIQNLAEMQRDKVVDIDVAGLRILPKGRLLAHCVARVFDSYQSVQC